MHGGTKSNHRTSSLGNRKPTGEDNRDPTGADRVEQSVVVHVHGVS